MARDYKERLNALKHRRQALDPSQVLLAKALGFPGPTYLEEAYEKRGKTDALRYALGAMSAVGQSYTSMSYEEGERVRKQLADGLAAASIPVQFEYQGSVPLDIHIQGASDIDLLALHTSFLTYDPTGPKAATYTPINVSILDQMQKLRKQCESILSSAFPRATVEKNDKSVSIRGGSLKLKVDVVPAHWYDTAAYQQWNNKRDREVSILDVSGPKTLTNRPFLHMALVNEKDQATSGCAKKVIRLLKTLKKDMREDIRLTSYDIASLVWHFDTQLLNQPDVKEPTLIAVTQAHFVDLLKDPVRTIQLKVPDQTRDIFDDAAKYPSLVILKTELDRLAEDIVEEMQPALGRSPHNIQKTLLEATVF